MQRTYNIIREMVSDGYVVLAYDRRIPKGRTRYLTRANFDRRVALHGDIMYVDGNASKGWTFARRPVTPSNTYTQ